MDKTTAELANLSPQEQRALLAQLVHKKAAPARLAPLSFTQERIWFLDQLEPGSLAFNMTAAVRLTGQLDVEALQRSLNEIVRRHETLRATFVPQDGNPVQVISPVLTVMLPLVDLCQLPERERETRARKLIAAQARCPFDLARGPLLRVCLLKLGQEHIFLVNVHHIVSDGWSQAVLLRELAAHYEIFVSGRPSWQAGRKQSPLPELPIQYADFAQWQRQTQQAEALERELVYWKGQLASPLPVLELITDCSHATTKAQAERRTYTLSPSLAKALKVLSHQRGATLFMTLLAAFKTLLHRYTGQTDIIIGSPIANRDRAEVEGLIGPFINTLVLRTDLSGNPTFLELLDRVRQVVLEAFEHSNLPFEQLVDALQPQRDLNRNPLFQIVFILQDLPTVSLELSHLRLEPFPIDLRTAEAPDLLGISMQDTPQGLVAVLECRADLLNQRALEHLETLLESVVADPHQRLSDLPILTPAEQYQLLVAWNDTRAEYPADCCYPQLFEAQARRTPDAVAAVCGDAQLSYRQLDRRANRLARLLIEHGCGPDTVVTLFAERGLEFLTAILAVFKAGGAYLPLDPRYPVRRLQQVLRQSRSPLVLADDEFLPLLSDALADVSPQVHPIVLCLAEILDRQGSADDLPARSVPRNLAYVIYTSGSTGVPKGAMLEQRGLSNHLHAKLGALSLTQTDVVAQNATQSFDISVWQFLAALLAGGRVEIFKDEIAYDPVRLLEQVACRRVTVLEIVPSLLRAMLEHITQSERDPFELASLRWLMPTGEALPPDLARDWLNRYPHCLLINAYGPSECSDDVTHGFLTRPLAAEAVRVPIGCPVANLRLYVLDPWLRPLPAGVAGELYVGGVGVGRGYLYEPQKTAQAFIPNPFTPPALRASPPPAGGTAPVSLRSIPERERSGGSRAEWTEGGRLYKTGDLACYRPDGTLEFLGRVDHQVKVRGFRIEMGEIEAVLGQQPAVREAVVVAWDGEQTPGETQLAAYVVPVSKDGLTPDNLRETLRKQLPDYMLPSAFVFLDALPLTPNGKVDRRALPAPDLSQLGRAVRYVAPTGLLEEKLAQIWSQALGIGEIGVYDDFFSLGGHSLLATQVIHRINRTFEIKLALRSIFEESTIAGLALLVEEALIDELDGVGT